MHSSDYMKIDLNEWKAGSQKNSLSYFSRKKQVSISKDMINELKKVSRKNGRINARFCLHSSPDENLQDMVILEYRDKKCRKPHKHLDSNEAIHLIEGEILAFIFNDRGKLIDKRVLEEKEDFIYRNAQNRQHLYFPITEYAIYREIRGGEFKRENIVSPNWDFIKILGKYISPKDLICKNESCKNPCDLFFKKT